MADVEVVKDRRLLIRTLQSRKVGHEKLMTTVKGTFPDFSERTYYRDLAVIRKSARKWARDLTHKDMPAQLQASVDALEDVQRRLSEIIESPASKTHDKIEALKALADIEEKRLNLLGYTTTVIAPPLERP